MKIKKIKFVPAEDESVDDAAYFVGTPFHFSFEQGSVKRGCLVKEVDGKFTFLFEIDTVEKAKKYVREA